MFNQDRSVKLSLGPGPQNLVTLKCRIQILLCGTKNDHFEIDTLIGSKLFVKREHPLRI